jgi:hypothetical protein
MGEELLTDLDWEQEMELSSSQIEYLTELGLVYSCDECNEREDWTEPEIHHVCDTVSWDEVLEALDQYEHEDDDDLTEEEEEVFRDDED